MRGVSKPDAERNANDAYFTPAPLALAICRELQRRIMAPGMILVPGAGEGAFLRASKEVWPDARQHGLDIDPKLAGILQCNYLTFEPSELGGVYDLIIGNPPFDLAEEFVVQSFKHLAPRGHLAFLLRLSFLGSQGRAERIWSRRDLRWLAPISPRPSFSVDGKTDAAEYGLFVWEKGALRKEPRIITPLIWERK